MYADITFFIFKVLERFGVSKDWEVVDIYGTDPDLLAVVPQPVLAVILLFPMTENVSRSSEEGLLRYYVEWIIYIISVAVNKIR